MPRKLRVQYPGAMYHVMSRGDQREDSLFVTGREWCLGSEAFRDEQLAWMEDRLGEHHAGELRLESAHAKADRLVAEELRRLAWSAEDLVRRPKNDPGKLALAVRLRRETTLSIRAISARVNLGTYNTANARLHQAMKAEHT